mgnify:FL=1|jgi:hypothetical protein
MDDIKELQRLAGIGEWGGYKEIQFEDPYQFAADNRQKEKEQGINPGTDEWFKMWFGNPNPYNNPPQFRGRTKK